MRGHSDMKKFTILAALSLIAGCGPREVGDHATKRQADATRTSMNAADREIGMPRIANFSQRKLLKNAYEDMDQTTLTYVYTQSLDGRFVCLGQAVGYGVSLGTQFTAPEYPQYIRDTSAEGPAIGTYTLAQPDPNGLYQPTSGAATIVNLVDPANGEAHTALVEPSVVTVPFKLPASVVNVPCPGDVDPSKVKDAKETSAIKQRN
jgi:predicted small lipoprotein YifL